MRAGVLCVLASVISFAAVVDASAAQVRCHGLRATIVGTAGDDEIRGTARRDVIVSRAGFDIIYANGGDDVVCGGSGASLIRGGPGSDQLFGGAGSDDLDGGRGLDTLYGGDGPDTLSDCCLRNRDRLLGGSGDDDLDTSFGSVDGGPGDDYCIGEGPIVNCEPLRVGGALLPGDYELDQFQPAFTFSAAVRGWYLFWRDKPETVILGWYGPPASTDFRLTFHRAPAVVFEPEHELPVAAPSDLFAWLAAHPCVAPRAPARPITIGTASGLVGEFTGLCDL